MRKQLQKAYITIRKSKRSREKNLIFEIQIFKVREEFLPEFEMVSFVLSEPKGAKIKRVIFPCSFLVADMQLYKSLCPSVRRSVGWSVGEHESKSVKTRISAPAHLSATGMAVYPALFSLFFLFDFLPICKPLDYPPEEEGLGNSNI